VACPPSGTRRRRRTGAPTGAPAIHPVRRLAQHTGLEREPVGPAPIVRRSTPVSSSRASAATCAARVPAVSPNGSGPPTGPPSAPPSSRPSKTPATCTSPKARATIPSPPKPSASTASIRTEADIRRTRRSPAITPAARSGGVDVASCRCRWMVSQLPARIPWHPGTGLKAEEAIWTPWCCGGREGRSRPGGQALGQGWRTILPGMPPAAFALNASAARASGYTAPTWGRRCPSSTRRASWIS
jgi:hypothetical protein